MGPRRSAPRGSLLACSIALVLACGSSPTAPGIPLLLVGELTADATNSHLLVIESSGIMGIAIVDLRAVLWDVTLGGDFGDVGELSLGFGMGKLDADGACVITGQLLVREGESYLWSVRSGEQCALLFDSGIIPQDSVLAYEVLLELPV